MYKKIETLILIPFFFSLSIGCVKHAALPNSTENFAMLLGYGYSYYLIGGIPLKIIVFIINKVKNNSWNWPIGFKYFIIPIILFLFIEFFVPNLF
jgi:hypothetical protein